MTRVKVTAKGNSEGKGDKDKVIKVSDGKRSEQQKTKWSPVTMMITGIRNLYDVDD